jgi:hypothetical protein
VSTMRSESPSKGWKKVAKGILADLRQDMRKARTVLAAFVGTVRGPKDDLLLGFTRLSPGEADTCFHPDEILDAEPPKPKSAGPDARLC